MRAPRTTPSSDPATPSAIPSPTRARRSWPRVTPSARNNASDRRLRSTESDCVENTRKAPVNSATRASIFKLTRYARVTLTARSRSTCGATASTPAGSFLPRARRKPSTLVPGASRKSMRFKRPTASKVHCAEAISITPRGCGKVLCDNMPITRSDFCELPTMTRSRSPRRKFNSLAAAPLR